MTWVEMYCATLTQCCLYWTTRFSREGEYIWCKSVTHGIQCYMENLLVKTGDDEDLRSSKAHKSCL